MKAWTRLVAPLAFVLVAAYSPLALAAQDSLVVLAGKELTRVIPPGFYFQGQSAPTQMRNAAAVRLGNRHVMAGLVDTSGYAADVRAKYEGFLITDSAIEIGGSELSTGAYGFGFTDDGKINVLDLAGNQILSISTTKDSALARPRPLMMTKAGNEVRFYGGKEYVVIAFK
jgi:hypothetical protein